MRYPRTYLESIRLQNFRSYSDYTLSFVNERNGLRRVFGFYGPNGSGKSTMIEAITLLFASFKGYEPCRLMNHLAPCVRNWRNMSPTEQAEASFRIEATFRSEVGRYVVVVSRDPADYLWEEGIDGPVVTGLRQGHPRDISVGLSKQCFLTRYDQELRKFQLRQDRWDLFKPLFESVTGFSVEKRDPLVDTEGSGEEAELRRAFNQAMGCLDEFVLGLKITKPHEIITERECSDGERKILKAFTTLLNKEYVPSIILIDNVELHVEIDRHVMLLNCIESCFPESQLFVTTHSERLITSYDLGRMASLVNKAFTEEDRWRLEMLRILKPFRLLCGSELQKNMDKIQADLEGSARNKALMRADLLSLLSEATKEIEVRISEL